MQGEQSLAKKLAKKYGNNTIQFLIASNSTLPTSEIVKEMQEVQNVSKHAKPINGVKEGMFSLKTLGDSFLLSVSNTIPKEDKANLENILSGVKKLSIDEIKTLYNEKLVDPEFTVVGQCGLGILEIARSSACNFAYSFTPTDEDDVLFTLNITV